MFKQYVHEIFALLDTNAVEISRYAGCDRSHISRMASGSRIPKKDGSGADRLASALVNCAIEKGKLDVLCAFIPCGADKTFKTVKSLLLDKLYEGADRSALTKRPKSAVLSHAFGEKLSMVMALTELSNIRFGRMLSLDPSYISRFRCGRRFPGSNAKVMQDICFTLTDRAFDQGKERELALMIGFSEKEIAKDRIYDALYTWLYTDESFDSAPIVERVIGQIGAFSLPPVGKSDRTFEVAPPQETAELYYGEEGLRGAVLRFLGDAIARKAPELCLYSDQGMDWLVADRSFFEKWAQLMLRCLKGGTVIHIIHNVNRGFSELFDAIGAWLPLYSVGGIRSYYFRQPIRTKFSTTLFLCPGSACISGENVTGTEQKLGIYRYETDAVLLEVRKAAFSELLKLTGQLVHAHNTIEVGRYGSEDAACLAVLETTLSLATMPEDVLIGALSRAKVSDTTRERILETRQKRREILLRNAEKGFLYEFVPLPSREDLKNGKVPMDLPDVRLFYTEEEFARHANEVIGCLDRLKNYRLSALPSALFGNVKILISDNVVSVLRTEAPYITIQFEHPVLCRAFVTYADKVRLQYEADKEETRKLLESYL